MNSFVRCLVMLTYTLVIYRLKDGLIVGHSYEGVIEEGLLISKEKYITKEFCEKRVAKIKYRWDKYYILEYTSGNGSFFGKPIEVIQLGLMCVPSKDL